MQTRFKVGQIVAVQKQSFRGKVVEDEAWRVGFYIGRTNGNFRVVLVPVWPERSLEPSVWTNCVPVQDVFPAMANFKPCIV